MTALEAAYLLALFAPLAFSIGFAVMVLAQRCIDRLWPTTEHEQPRHECTSESAEREDYDWITSDHAALGTTGHQPPHHLEH